MPNADDRLFDFIGKCVTKPPPEAESPLGPPVKKSVTVSRADLPASITEPATELTPSVTALTGELLAIDDTAPDTAPAILLPMLDEPEADTSDT